MREKKGHSTPAHDHPSSFEKVELVHGGEDYFLRVNKVISEAKSELHFQTYIFDDDATGREVATALKEAATRGVKVYLLLDGYGAGKLTKDFTNDLLEHGIHFRFFSPLFSINSLYLGRRLHHKVLVADGNIALIGGMNVADKYHGTETEAPWLDYAVQLEGEVAKPIQELCMDIYRRKWRHSKRKLSQPFHASDGTLVRIRRNDWVMRKNEIDNSYIAAVRSVKEELTIVNSYFLPGKRFANVLIKTSDKGKVKIRLVLSGISDVPVVRRATCYLYDWLLRHHIELYEWNTSVLHAKIAVADSQWSTVGSFNLNHLSSYGCIEMNVEVQSPRFGTELATHLDDIIAQCEPITATTLQARKRLLTNFVNWCAYTFVRLAMIVVTYVPYKRWLKRFGNE